MDFMLYPLPEGAQAQEIQLQLDWAHFSSGLRKADLEDAHRRAFGRGSNPTRSNQNQNQNQNQNPPPNISRVNTSSPSAYSPSSLGPPSIPQAPASPSLTQSMTTNNQAHNTNNAAPRGTPFFFREEYTGFIVRGNFNTLAAKPILVEEGEWMAHQMVEQNRLLNGMITMLQGEDKSSGRSLCNEQTCPQMTAGSAVYPWIDTNRNPIQIPAAQYIKNIQTWVNGKIQDQSLFPTDNFSSAPPLPSPTQTTTDGHWLGKTSGFPQRFETEIKNMYKQMFRCYAHLYWQHWLSYWENNANRDLNTCFVHFMNVALMFGLLAERDMEPMQPLIDIWVGKGILQRPGENGSATAPVSAGGAAAPATSATTAASAATPA